MSEKTPITPNDHQKNHDRLVQLQTRCMVGEFLLESRYDSVPTPSVWLEYRDYLRPLSDQSTRPPTLAKSPPQ